MSDKWISVKDYLPEPGLDNEVLVLHCSGMEVMYYVPDDGIHCWGWYPGGLPIESSTHWRPLPKLPKGY